MISNLQVHMAEALRLTRTGRLTEAMALLQGSPPLRAKSPDAAEGWRRASTPADHPGQTIDMVRPGTAADSWSAPGTETRQHDAARTAPPSPPQMGASVRGLLDRLGKRGSVLGLSGLAGDYREGAGTRLPDGAHFEEHAYTNAAGSREYKLFVPSGYYGEKLPLIVMLHGCKQSPDDFAAGTRMNELAEERGFFVAYPRQSSSANSSRCWNWFSADGQLRDRGEPSLIAGITCQIMRNMAVDAERIYIAGLSAGGATAAIMGSAYPDLYAAIGVHSGLACGAAKDLPTAFTAMRQGGSPSPAARPMPTIVFHGDRDITVSPLNGDQVITQSMAGRTLNQTVHHGQSAGGVHYTRTLHANQNGEPILEQWILHGVGHAWAGGSHAGSYTDSRGPDASREMVRFFLERSAVAT